MRKISEKTTSLLVFIAMLPSFRARTSSSNNHVRTKVKQVIQWDGLSDRKTVGFGDDDDDARLRDPATLQRANVHGDFESIPTLRRLPEVLYSQLTRLYVLLLIGFLMIILLRGLQLYTFRVVCFRF